VRGDSKRRRRCAFKRSEEGRARGNMNSLLSLEQLGSLVAVKRTRREVRSGVRVDRLSGTKRRRTSCKRRRCRLRDGFPAKARARTRRSSRKSTAGRRSPHGRPSRGAGAPAARAMPARRGPRPNVREWAFAPYSSADRALGLSRAIRIGGMRAGRDRKRSTSVSTSRCEAFPAVFLTTTPALTPVFRLPKNPRPAALRAPPYGLLFPWLWPPPLAAHGSE